MWNNRYNHQKYGGSSITKELEAIRETKLEREHKEELKLESEVKDLFDDKVYKSLKKILLKVTKAS